MCNSFVVPTSALRSGTVALWHAGGLVASAGGEPAAATARRSLTASITGASVRTSASLHQHFIADRPNLA